MFLTVKNLKEDFFLGGGGKRRNFMWGDLIWQILKCILRYFYLIIYNNNDNNNIYYYYFYYFKSLKISVHKENV